MKRFITFIAAIIVGFSLGTALFAPSDALDAFQEIEQSEEIRQ